MRYMLFIKHAEGFRSHAIPEGLMEAMGTFVTDALSSGRMIDTAGLKATSAATDVRLSDGKISVVDGPFAESKEIVGGFAIIDVASDKEALDLAREFMEIHRIHWPAFEGACEVRPYEDFEAPQ